MNAPLALARKWDGLVGYFRFDFDVRLVPARTPSPFGARLLAATAARAASSTIHVGA